MMLSWRWEFGVAVPEGSHRGRWTSSWTAASPRWTRCGEAEVWAEWHCADASGHTAGTPSLLSGTAGRCGVPQSAATQTRTCKADDEQDTGEPQLQGSVTERTGMQDGRVSLTKSLKQQGIVWILFSV